LNSPWAADDVPRIVRELLPALESYRGCVESLVRSLEEAAEESEKSHPNQITN